MNMQPAHNIAQDATVINSQVAVNVLALVAVVILVR